MEIKFDKGKLEGYPNDFYELTRIRVALFDGHSQILCSYSEGDSPFYTTVQTKLGLKEKCLESSANSFVERKKSNHICVYKCRASLMEATAALKSKGAVLDYAMMGQCSDINDKEKRYRLAKERFSSFVKTSGIERKKLAKSPTRPSPSSKAQTRLLRFS